MSADVIEQLLTAESVLIPFEPVDGTKQVSAIVTVTDGAYASFELVDGNSASLDGIFLIKSELAGDRIRVVVEADQSCVERCKLRAIDVVGTNFLVGDKMVTAISELSLLALDGRVFRLSEHGARYAYNLTLTVKGPEA